MKYICVDIGGTAIKYALADKQGNLQDKGEIPTEVAEKGARQMLDRIIALVNSYRAKEEIGGVAIATAGIVEPKAGVVVRGPAHFPGYTGMEVKRAIEAGCQLPCTVENDVNAVGLGEYWLGGGKGAESLFCMAVGTGIGGSLILGGRLVHGATNSTGEIGLSTIRPGEVLENQASMRTLVERVARAKKISPKELNGKIIFAKAKEGDNICLAAIDDMVADLAVAITNLCLIVNPQVVLIGGGFTAQEEYLLPKLRQAVKARLLPQVYAGTKIDFAKLHNDAGMVGALYYFLTSRHIIQ